MAQPWKVKPEGEVSSDVGSLEEADMSEYVRQNLELCEEMDKQQGLLQEDGQGICDEMKSVGAQIHQLATPGLQVRREGAMGRGSILQTLKLLDRSSGITDHAPMRV